RGGAGTRPGESFTRWLGTGGMTSARASRTTGSRLELHLRRGGGLGHGLEIRLGLEPSKAGDHAVGEDHQPRVVVLHGLVVPPTLDGDPVLGARELPVELLEVLVGLKLLILFYVHQ